MSKHIKMALDALRAAAKGRVFDEATAEAKADIEAAISHYNVAALHAVVHDDQARPREAMKVLEPVIGHLSQLGERLDELSGERWRDFPWIAADAYTELPEVQEDLERWNAELSEQLAGTDAELSDYVRTEVDQFARDIGELRTIVARVEPRLKAVQYAMSATNVRGGRPPNIARNALFRDLRAIYEHHTGCKATASIDGSDLGARSAFVDFVVSVNSDMRPPLPLAALGLAIKNFLYPPKARKGV